MSHACGCHQSATAGAGAGAGPSTAALTPGLTVEEVSRRFPGVREVLARFGVDHCCGARLPLEQAAAAAGVPVEALLRALREAVERPG